MTIGCGWLISRMLHSLPPRPGAEGILKYNHNESIQCLAYNPVTQQLASGTASDLGLWSPEQKSVSKRKVNSKILSMSWTNDGLHIALGLFSGHVSIRDKFGEDCREKADIVRQAPIWTLAWNPVQTKQDPTDVLVVGCWDQTLSFYKVSGQEYGREHRLEFDPCSIDFFSSGDYFVLGGSGKKVQLWSREGIYLGDLGERDDWIWSCAVRPRQDICFGTGGSKTCDAFAEDLMYFAHRHDRQEMLPPIMPSYHLRSGRSVDKARRLPSRTPQVSSTTSLGDTTGSIASLGGYSQGSSSRDWDDQRHHARHGSPSRRDPSRERRNSLRGRQNLPLTAREPRHRRGPDPDGDLITTITFGAERTEGRTTAETPESNLPTLTPPPTANAVETWLMHFLRKGAGVATQEAVAAVNRQRFGRRQPQHEEVEEVSPPSRPPLPHINQITSERTSLRRPSVGIPTIELTRLGTDSDVLPALQRAPSSTLAPSDSIAWPDSASSAADDPTSPTRLLEAFDVLSPNNGHATTINVWVQEPERRGISAMQFERFFNRFCGDDLEEPKPLCLPTTLCQACVQANRADPEVKNRSKRPRETNLYAVTELIIKPETAMLGVSYSELINPDGLQVDYFISHHWAEDFGERHAIVAAPEMGGLMEWTSVVYWCCAFANNQHQERLREALTTPRNLNQAATALDRIWCIYEVYLTHSLEKPFTLNFKLGPLVGVVQETTLGSEGRPGLGSVFVG
eukprot:s1071_g1.t1